MISFDVSARDAGLIVKIVNRAAAACRLAGAPKLDRHDVAMSLTACHANGCPLDLEKLLAADDFNLLHDVTGIHRHISTEDAQLGGCFLPRACLKLADDAANAEAGR
ncbi:hypothetical protein D3877_12795 [Azospirillum cavernae]|uniref:DUF6874 domain-containing protein n=1 Tax=Azospirillum cavernae TaxID=2320860 RepID=A0A418VVA9_9PROT|nr:hypothetical protein [Azospirillum cavernae]RJF81096.1 hypothetical protein D3877_12795 [Azospirillum cavernae]